VLTIPAAGRPQGIMPDVGWHHPTGWCQPCSGT
jgi:hypothetical protein